MDLEDSPKFLFQGMSLVAGEVEGADFWEGRGKKDSARALHRKQRRLPRWPLPPPS